MKKIIALLFSLVLVMLMLDACRHEPIEPIAVMNPAQIQLIWHQNDSETHADLEDGLRWCFSYLGATLPTGSLTTSMNWNSDTSFVLDMGMLGFSEKATDILIRLIAISKQSEAYQLKGGMDAGRWVVTLFNNPNHYYKIVDVASNIEDFNAIYAFLDTLGGIKESAVAKSERRIFLPKTLETMDLGFKAEEIEGDLSGSFQVKEFEVFDFMPNGQPRFAVYDTNGFLMNGANAVFSNAGKPSKCMWCHESIASRAFAASTSTAGYYSISQFDSIIDLCNNELAEYRSTLSSDLDYLKKQEHTQLEKLYIRFMEPSAKRLASEWGISILEVQNRLSSLNTHTNPEFPEMGALYFRFEVEDFAPFQSIPVGSDARETNEDEPNLIP
jgi:hypothetical protein